MLESTSDQQAELLALHRQRLYILEQQAAQYGLLVPSHVQVELGAVRDQISELERNPAIASPTPPTPDVAKDIVFIFDTDADGGYTVTVRAPDGTACQASFVKPWSEDRINYILYVLRTAARSTATVRSSQLHQAGISPQEVGSQLYEAMFSAKILDIYNHVRHSTDGPVRLRLHIETPALARLPWELLHDGNDFICLDRDTPLVRGVRVRPRTLAAELPVRILVIGGVANDAVPLRIDEELAMIERKLKPSIERGEIHLHSLIGSTLERDLPSTLGSFRPHILHVAGHGGVNGLFVPDSEGRSHHLSASTLRMLLRNVKSIQIVVLNGCELATNSDTDMGVAAILARVGIPTVVGMQFEISDTAALAFTEGFYEAIGWGWSAEESVSWARSRMSYYAASPDVMEWVTPAVYVASDDVQVGLQPVVPLMNVSNDAIYRGLLEITWEDEVVSSTDIERLERKRAELGISLDRALVLEQDVRATLAAAALEAAQRAHKDGDLEQARSCYRRTLVLDPNNRVALAMMRRWNAWPGYLAPMTADNVHQIEQMWSLYGPGRIFAVAWSPNSQYLALAAEWGIVIYNIDTLQVQFKLSGSDLLCYSLAWSPDGRFLAAGRDDGKIRIWDLIDSREIAPLQGPDAHVNGLAFRPGERSMLAAGDNSGNLNLWSVESCAAPASQEPPVQLESRTEGIYGLAWSLDGSTLASGASDYRIHLIQPDTGAYLELAGHTDWVRRLAWSPDGRTLASSSGDQTVCLWDCETGTLKSRMQGHAGWVRGLTWSVDGRLIFSGGGDGFIRVWSSALHEQVRALGGDLELLNDLAMRPDGRVLAAGSFEGRLTLWGIPPADPADQR